MTDTQQRNAAKKFAEDWKNKGYEKGQSQPFWLSLLRDVYGVESPEQFIQRILSTTTFPGQTRLTDKKPTSRNCPEAYLTQGPSTRAAI